jgi:hypothetical protein
MDPIHQVNAITGSSTLAAAEATTQTGVLGVLLVMLMITCASMVGRAVTLLQGLVDVVTRVIRFLVLAIVAGALVFGLLLLLVADLLTG